MCHYSSVIMGAVASQIINVMTDATGGGRKSNDSLRLDPWQQCRYSSNGNITGSLWGESIGHRRIPLTKASDAEIWCIFDLRLNTRLSKQPRRRWRLCNDNKFGHNLFVSIFFSARNANIHKQSIAPSISGYAISCTGPLLLSWISTFIPHLIMDVITCCDLS